MVLMALDYARVFDELFGLLVIPKHQGGREGVHDASFGLSRPSACLQNIPGKEKMCSRILDDLDVAFLRPRLCRHYPVHGHGERQEWG